MKELIQEPEIINDEMGRDDFIDFILRHTEEDAVFRTYLAKHYILVGIDLDTPST